MHAEPPSAESMSTETTQAELTEAESVPDESSSAYLVIDGTSPSYELNPR
jgi:hypothetical protein